jgi:pyruvate/2-oxoglutarate dehydrogenase complex dihydrolipoamide acyltransferase (E2) component
VRSARRARIRYDALMKDDHVGSFETRPFFLSRTFGLDTIAVGRATNHVAVLIEVDVTDARRAILRRKERAGSDISFTGWVVKCLAQAVSEHRRIQAMRRRRKKLVIFDDVDVYVMVQRRISKGEPPETLPIPYVVRKANEKDLGEIHDEIRAVQAETAAAGEPVVRVTDGALPWHVRAFLAMPSFIRRRLVFNRLARDPFYHKRTMGTVGITSMGMYGSVRGGESWPVPIGIAPLIVALGTIALKPGVVGDSIEPREILAATVLFDHDVIDGGPVFLFIDRLRELMEGAYVL